MGVIRAAMQVVREGTSAIKSNVIQKCVEGPRPSRVGGLARHARMNVVDT